MSEHGSQYIIPPRLTVETVKERLTHTFPLADDGELPRRRSFYDTFDWRLYRKGLTLEEERSEHGLRVVMRDLATGAVQRWIDGIEMPRFADDFPRGPFRERVRNIVSVRALLPMSEMRSNTHQLRLRDQEDKTVARIELELATCGNGSHAQRLSKRLNIVGVRGHPAPLSRLVHFADNHLQLPLAENALLDEGLAAYGRRANDYSNKPDVELNPREPARQAVCRILRALLDIIETNVTGTREHIDTEFLHDLRVSVRRTRTLLGETRSVFTPAELKLFRSEFRWLGSITGPCRDLDVYLLAFDEYRSVVPKVHRPALDPVYAYLQRRHVEEQRRLAQWLDSTRFRALIVNWREFLNNPGFRDDEAPDAGRKLKKFADQRIWAAYQRVRDRGRSIRRKTPAAKVHRLRLHAKKLRYLMELFRTLYPKKKIGAYVSALKELQENLGDFHDYHVQAEALRGFARDMDKEHLASAATITAVNELAATLEKRQAQARKEFSATFADFDRPRNRHIARELFKPGKRK